MRSFFACLCMLFLIGAISKQANAQLICTNQTDKPVWIAIAYNYTPADSGWEDNTWVTEGWKYINPKDSVILSEHMGYDREMGIKNNFFFYAFQPNGREWKGIRKFALDSRSPDKDKPDEYEFRITRAHKEITVDPRRNPHNKRYLFKGGVLGDKPKDVITLRQSDIDDTPDSAAASDNPFGQPAKTGTGGN